MIEETHRPKIIDWKKGVRIYLRGIILLAGVLSALWVTFLYPPLTITGGSGSTVNARGRCQQIGENYVRNPQPPPPPVAASTSSKDHWLFGPSPAVQAEAEKQIEQCLKISTVDGLNLFLQIAVIAAVTWLLVNFTRIIK